MSAEFDAFAPAPETFWSREATHKAVGQIVGVALLTKAYPSQGPLAWDAEHRFWVMSNIENAPLAFFDVKQAFALGDFMCDGITPDSGSLDLMPVPAYPSRRPLFKVSGLLSDGTSSHANLTQVSWVRVLATRCQTQTTSM
jgi:hypothetical protein